MPRPRSTAAGRFVELGKFGGPDLEERRVRAYVPRAPDETHEPKRPVLVLFDGQNVFGDHGSFAGGWHAHLAADRLAAMGRVRAPEGKRADIVAPVIIGVDHGGASRIDELGGPHSAKLATLIALLADRILPEAHARLALQYGPGAHFIGGSSMGGLAALYTHFRRPDVFGGAIAMSPSIWFGRRAIFDFVAKQSNPYRSRVYLDAGRREGGGRLVPLTESMSQHLESRGWSDRGELRVVFRADAKGTHNEAHWRRRLPKALRFLFGP